MEAHVSALVSKKSFFFPYVILSTSSHGQRHHRGLAVAAHLAGVLGWPLPLCPQRLCTGGSTREDPLFPCVTPTTVSPGRNLYPSAVCICKGCAFHPGYLPCASPPAAPQPAHTPGFGADFCPPGGWPGSHRPWCCSCPSQPSRLPCTRLGGCSSPKYRRSSNLPLL